MRARLFPVLAAVLVTSCNGKGDDSGDASAFEPDLACPGSAGCETADGALKVGAAKVSVLPSCWETWTDANEDWEYHTSDGDTFDDCGCDRLCSGDDGYPGPDEGEGDGTFQTAWVAGFQNARAMSRVRGADEGLFGEGDGLWAATTVLQKGDTTIAVVGIDGFGWMHDQVKLIREAVKADGVDHVVINSSHSHASIDTVGIYGPSLTRSGFNAEYAAEVREAVASSIRTALADLHEVEMVVGHADMSSYDPVKGITNVMSDTRDPWIIHPNVYAASFRDKSSGETVATWVVWGNHPEATADEHTAVSADHVHALRKTIEEGVSWDAYSREGIGGVAVYLQGPQGGMMTSLRITNTDPDGNDRREHGFEKADAIGAMVGEMALDALETGDIDGDPKLSVAMSELFIPVDNLGFQAMFLSGVIYDRPKYNYDPDAPLDDNNVPEVLSEVNVLRVGPIHMLTLPGEILPEVAFGGYDGSMIGVEGQPIVDPENPNPPQLDQAPSGPYLYDRLEGNHKWVLALSNDFIGYVIPEYNFVVDPDVPYIFEAEGDHYEETNSLGPKTAPLIQDAASQLLDWESAH